MALALFRRNTSSAKAATDDESATTDAVDGTAPSAYEATPEENMAGLLALSREARARREKIASEEAGMAAG
jgi:hypothetical protein